MLERQEGPVVTPPVFHQCQGRVPFHPGVICGLNFLLVLALLWGFFLGSPLFLPQQETTSPNCNLPMIEDWPESQQRLMWLPLLTLFSYLHLTQTFFLGWSQLKYNSQMVQFLFIRYVTCTCCMFIQLRIMKYSLHNVLRRKFQCPPQ